MKNLLLYSTIFLTGVSAFAQLTVKPPTTSSDAFVYVKNQIIYVENDINLTKNNAGPQEASIYLREGSQLIQGGKTSTNSGNGYLSVQQNSPFTNAYAYYYWASPVGNPVAVDDIGGEALPAGNTNFGLWSIFEDLSNGVGTEARISNHIGAKEGYTNPELTISKRWMYIHEDPGTEAEGNYHRINATNGVRPGFGFTMKGVNKWLIPGPGDPGTGSNHDQVYEFRGRPNNGDFEIPVLGPKQVIGGPALAQAKMTLTGNPYPSALDLSKVFYDSDNLALSAIFYYDEDRTEMSHLYSKKSFGYGVYIPEEDGPGNYTMATFYIWNSAGTQTGNDPSGTPRNFNDKRYAPIGQGFMFVGTDPDNEVKVKIKNSHRVFYKEGPGSIFFRPTGDDETADQNEAKGDPKNLTAQAPSNADNRTPQLRLYTIFDDALTRDMLLVFSPEATDGYDRGWDGLSPGGMKSDVFFPIGDDTGKLPYVIQGTNFSMGKEIPITIKLHKNSKIEMRAVEEIKKPYEKAYLFDRVENTYRPLLKAATASSSFNLPAGTYENRFYIVFTKPGGRESQEAMDYKDEILANVNFFQNNPEQRLEVRNPQGYTLKSASMYDINGKLVIHEKNLGDNNNYSFYTGHLSDGVYIVKLLTADDVAIDYKAIVMNK